MRYLTAAIACLIAVPALAQDIETKPADGSVTEVMDRLEEAVNGAGATVFARVDHTAGAESVGMEMPDAELLIFGNPKLGTPAMQENIQAGLMLPLRVLVYDDEGQTMIAWQEVEDMMDELGIDDDAEFVGQMEGAIGKLTDAAASE